ncbi:uncharacterized protein LOC115796848 [Archocentrus centrarchus]|uniref:uncharacterized protein LOC115796848 n=1 Tax=Archocentrus centrarchus TaxID=63155 RepID=UPI0011E9F08F|nr:uncharacterized protein LOC115796848 [Archocentrus centrarchus]
MGGSETKEQRKIYSGQPTTNYTGHQSSHTAAGRSLTLQPRRRKQQSRLKKRPASIDGSTGLWDHYDPSRRRYVETDLDLYYELQNHLENARQRMRDKGRKEAVSEGVSTSLVSGQEKCYDPNDSTLTFVDGDDEMDFECNNYKSLRAQMSCGHSVTPMSLTNWCQQLLDQGESRFVCGRAGCNAEWSYEEVCKMALLTPEEKEYFENKMFSSAAKDYLDVKAGSVRR